MTTQAPPKRSQWREGAEYICTNSASPGYKLNVTYTAHKNAKGILCLKGSDGWEDPVENLISSFKEVK